MSRFVEKKWTVRAYSSIGGRIISVTKVLAKTRKDAIASAVFESLGKLSGLHKTAAPHKGEE